MKTNSPAEETYLESCKHFQVEPDPNILVALSCNMAHLSLSSKFDIKSMLPLREVLRLNTSITSLSFRRCRLGSTVCYPLRDILQQNNHLVYINLEGNDIDFHGALALSEGLKQNKTLKELMLGNNRLGSKGASLLAQGLESNTSLKLLDVTTNNINVAGVKALELVCDKNKIVLITRGNFLREEFYNSLTHGLGLLLSIVGGISLMFDVIDYGKAHKWGVGLYVSSLIILYTSSTLCHALGYMRRAGIIFQVMDHAAIYILIAGSYTPYCLVNLAGSWTGVLLASFIWSLAVFGVTLASLQVDLKWEIILYVIMGWLIVFTGAEFTAALPTSALILLVTGGLAYTGGITFFVWGLKDPINHVIWHCFVLLGSALHYFSIREAVLHKS